ncbi:valine--tRNA ligase [Anaplasma phagocytophilum]|uniref:valine--tRNA ligase n=2 Tax=Anaplasma phagocytophilum TaxID=948 RepID=UPI00035B9A07|nr:valine--tRNA ligase [Anaplasma phagocytophilum]AGR80334.1 valyl-tRNA synthetase [Anaplasma phagocytophilum str. JM]
MDSIMTEQKAGYNHQVIEEQCQDAWTKSKSYIWKGRKDASFVIDTPPPTVSGSLHMGHVFSYCHADFIARYKRLAGFDVLFPIGFDDNGLPTERLIERETGVKASQVDRGEFIKTCTAVSKEYRLKYRQLFQTLGISFDWSREYHTASPTIQKLSQESFISLYNKGDAYRKQQPILWDVVDQTAISNAEIEDKILPSTMYTVRFQTECGESILIATTRPELMPACVAVFYHPYDSRYKHLEGKHAIVPVGGNNVRILPDDKVAIDKGTGLVMCCTFGDETDVYWRQKHALDTRIIIDKTGRLTGLEKLATEKSLISPTQFNGLRIKEARKAISETLAASGLISSQADIVHSVRCAERSGAPIEILPSEQWFIKIKDHKDIFKNLAERIKWHPDHMRKRLYTWIENLNSDWCISRQRFYGVPVPVWYSKRNGEEGRVILPNVQDLPIDPIKDFPRGYGKDEVIPDVDVMDTWATSSLSPMYHTMMLEGTCHEGNIPTDLRTQSHEIIRSWAFYTIAMSHLHRAELPWKSIMISGWCVAEDKTKMSKSKNNAKDPSELLKTYGADAIRYWASKARNGVDTVFSEEVIKTGKRLVTKLYNAHKFVQLVAGNIKPSFEAITSPLDQWIVTRLSKIVEISTKAYEECDYNTGLGVVEEFFIKQFCDNYIELSKHRAYNEEDLQGHKSALSSLQIVLQTAIALFSPIIPHVTHYISSNSETESPKWPLYEEIPRYEAIEQMCEEAMRIVHEIRRYKSENCIAMNHPLNILSISSRAVQQDMHPQILEDIRNALKICKITIEQEQGEDFIIQQ